MLKFFANNKPSLEEFVKTYKNLMLEDLKKIEQEEDYSQEEKDTIKSERYLSFEILDNLLASTKTKED
jgi:hypothetical protein